MQKLASQIIIEVLTEEMTLDSQSIWLRDQNKVIPKDDGLYIIVGMTDANVISSTSNTFTDVRGYVEETVTQLVENIQIDIFSRSAMAISRRWEIINALNSIFAKQKEEEYSFKINRLPSNFINTSLAEGGSQLSRYSLSFNCFVWYKKERVLDPNGSDYYEIFDTRVDDEGTIGQPNGLFEFTIDKDTVL